MSARSLTIATLGLAAAALAAPLDTGSVPSIPPFTPSVSACAELNTRADLDSVHIAAYSALCVTAHFTVGGSGQSTDSPPSSGVSVNAGLCSTLYDNTSIPSAELQAYVDACVAAHFTIHDKTPVKPTHEITADFCASIYTDASINSADLAFYAGACAAAHFATTVVSQVTAAASALVNAQLCASLYATAARFPVASISAYAAACAAANFATDAHIRRDVDASGFVTASFCSSLSSDTTLKPAEVKFYTLLCAYAGFSTSAHVERGMVSKASEQRSLRFSADVSLAIADVIASGAASASIESALVFNPAAFGYTAASRIRYLVSSLKTATKHVEAIGTTTVDEAEALYAQVAIFASERLQWLETIVVTTELWAQATVAASIHQALVSLQTEADRYTSALLRILPTKSSEVSSIQVTLHAQIQAAINASA